MIINESGGRDRLQLAEVPIPNIRDDEVLVKIHATSVNPVDWRAGRRCCEGIFRLDSR
ncbi:hypothetical protein [Polycladomyces subterraneus]|uniref:Alcohol dehydrogenase N-terminal domain-containing protein n=1 Tax=Polycladomyces subterraneus TaxID=1016997 RepID=A0ABT8IIQ3_9BACL|nr:hypothetical protein [Polycladomyces subterraneus]MDN4592609.1 hypothetical protein [Polycladomyces subterraneus]